MKLKQSHKWILISIVLFIIILVIYAYFTLFFLTLIAIFIGLGFIYKIFEKLFPDNPLTKRIQESAALEKQYVILITDDEIIVTHKGRHYKESVKWDDIQKIEVITTDEGPYLPDFYILLHGTDGGCAVPLGAENFDELFDRFATLQGFNYERYITATSSVDIANFIVWEKDKSDEE